MPSNPTPFTGSGLWVDESCTYRGFTLRETAGSTAVVRFRAGSVTGAILESLSFVANQSSSDWDSDGVLAEGGIYVEIVSGTVEGSLRWA